MSYSNILFFQREWVARGLAIVGLFLLVVSQQAFHLESPLPKPPALPMRISLAAPPVLVPVPPPVLPQPPVEPEPAPPKPTPKPKPIPKPTPAKPIAKPVPAKPVPAPAQIAAPVAVPDPAPPTPPAPLTPVTPPAPKPAPAPPPAPVSNPGHEASYVQQIRRQIEQHKVYPALARKLDMSGTVEVSYVVNRQGKLIDVEIAATSGSEILDKAALQAVRAAIFPPMPEDTWRGETQKQFKTKLVYSLTND
ncbi:MAG: energy transducer TonB [Sulfuriferula sp.]